MKKIHSTSNRRD